MAPPAAARETAGTTICLIVRYVRHHAGDDGVAQLLELAGDDRPIELLENEQHWSTYQQKINLLEAAATVLDDPDVALHIGETALEHSVGPGIRILLRRLGSPRMVLANVAKAAPKFSTVTDMYAEHLGKDFAVIRYRIQEPFRPHRADCLLNIGFMRTIGVLFGMAPLRVEHPECQVLGAAECEYVVHWTKRRRGRRGRDDGVLTDQVDALEAQLALLQSTTADLVSSDDVDEVLARIVTSAGRSVSAPGYLLALYDTVEVTDRVHADGIDAADLNCVAAEVLAGPLGVTDGRIVIEVASSRQRYGRLAAFYDDHSFFAFEEGLLAAYAQSAAAALDAATALDQARRRGAATAALLQLARSLAEPASPRRIARIVAGAMVEILDVHATAVLLWDDDDRNALRVAGRSGWSPASARFIDAFELPAEAFQNVAAILETEGARIVRLDADSASPMVNELRRLGVPILAVAPIRAHHGEFYGLAIAAVTEEHEHRVDTVTERLLAIGDQAATAVQNAQLLEQIRHQAVHDDLTGLANRALFDEELDKTLARARRDQTPVTVLFVDLDDFKSINDRFGHGAGDHVLRTVGERLVTTGRKGDWVARLGGDEFTMLLPGCGPADAERIRARLRDAIRQPITVGTELLSITPSVGVACFPGDGSTSDALLRGADRSMYQVKHTGRVPAELCTVPARPAEPAPPIEAAGAGDRPV
jgi:diguanylate cyclase (GGDEF)-like protein